MKLIFSAIALALTVPTLVGQARAAVTQDEMQSIIAGLPHGGEWSDARITDLRPLLVELIYHNYPSNLSVPRVDSEAVAASVIKAIVALGHDPQKEYISVYVNAEKDGETTVTGRPGVIPYGAAYYDYNDDAIKWRAD